MQTSLRSPRRTRFLTPRSLCDFLSWIRIPLASNSCELFDEINRLAGADRSSFVALVESLQSSSPHVLTSGAVVTRSSVRLDVERLPLKLAMNVQNALWSQPAAREALLNLFLYFSSVVCGTRSRSATRASTRASRAAAGFLCRAHPAGSTSTSAKQSAHECGMEWYVFLSISPPPDQIPSPVMWTY